MDLPISVTSAVAATRCQGFIASLPPAPIQ